MVTTEDNTPYLNIGSLTPVVSAEGGWVAPTDCAFILNGQGTVAGKTNVGVRFEGTWTNGALNLKYTVGTNGERGLMPPLTEFAPGAVIRLGEPCPLPLQEKRKSQSRQIKVKNQVHLPRQ